VAGRRPTIIDMRLPDALTSRPLTLADAAAVTAVMAAEELADTGTVAIEEADIVADWQRPSFDISAATIGVFDGPRLLGYAEHSGHDRGDAAVDPVVHGRGIGTFLAQWLEDRCRSAGAAVIGMPVPLGSPADRFLAARGYAVRWTSWILVLPPATSIPERPLPEGHVLRDARDEDLRAAWTVLEDAFLEWSERPREPFQDFVASVVDRPGHQPWNLRVLAGPSDEIIGACHIVLADDCGYVDRIAVRKADRGRGLAQAMLADAFEHARAHGATRSELSTDSRTGALGLYEKVGMVISSTWVNRALTL
ncbi:MAG TPA: GNAT family N-acetyltransferase, partial [Nocardioides sp.]